MVTVEQLYQNFGVLADAKDKAGEVTFVCKYPCVFCRIVGEVGGVMLLYGTGLFTIFVMFCYARKSKIETIFPIVQYI